MSLKSTGAKGGEAIVSEIDRTERGGLHPPRSVFAIRLA